jgi:hypothetical protein
MKSILDFRFWILDWKKPRASSVFVLFVSFVVIVQGCADSPQIGFQPAGHDNEFKVAESLPIGDNAGDDLIKDYVAKTTAVRMQAEQIEHLNQTLAESQTEATTHAETINRMVQRNAGRDLIDISGGAVILALFAFAVIALDKWAGYKRVSISQAEGIACAHRTDGSVDSALSAIRPRIRRLPGRWKRNFDQEMERHGCLIPTAPNTSD